VSWNDPIKDIERKMRVDPDLFLIAELPGQFSGEIVATVMGGYEGHRGWINYLAVSPDHQRKGYARAMMQQVEVLIQAKGCPKINLQVRSTNTSVIKFYQAIGYDVENVVGLGKRLIPDD
jgi:ribosomal protein S18 acetylase RimI-like enzyme